VTRGFILFAETSVGQSVDVNEGCSFKVYLRGSAMETIEIICVFEALLLQKVDCE